MKSAVSIFLLSLLPFYSNANSEVNGSEYFDQFDGLMDMAVQGAQDEEKQKEILCNLKAVNGEIAVGYYNNRKDGFTKQQAQDMLLGDLEPGSLDYILNETALNTAYGGASIQETTQTVFDRCMQESLDWVTDGSMTVADMQEGEELDRQWQAAGCDDKMEKLSMVGLYQYEGASEEKLRGIISSAVDDKAMAKKMGDAIMNSEEEYSILLDQFEMNCGS